MANEYELEALPELEGESEWEAEGEGEWEWESEGEEESEEFFRRIVSLARRAASSPALRQVGLRAARGALSGLGGVGAALGGSIGGARGASLGRGLGGVLGDLRLERVDPGKFSFGPQMLDQGEAQHDRNGPELAQFQ